MTTRSPFFTPNFLSPPASRAVLNEVVVVELKMKFLITYSIEKFLVGDFPYGVCDWTIVDECNLISKSIRNVTINAIKTCIEVATTEPLGERWTAIIKNLIIHLIPWYHLSAEFTPKLFRLFNRSLIIMIHVITRNVLWWRRFRTFLARILLHFKFRTNTFKKLSFTRILNLNTTK